MFSTNQIIRGTLKSSSLAARLCCRLWLAASIVSVLCISGLARAGDQVPFKAAFTGLDYPSFPDACTILVGHVDEGEATELGQCTYTSTSISDGCGSLLGHDDDVVLTAANGDQLFGHSVDISVEVDDSDPATAEIVGDTMVFITGGTGRFANTSGTFLMSFVAKLYQATTLPDGTLVVPNFFTLDGTLTSVGAARK